MDKDLMKIAKAFLMQGINEEKLLQEIEQLKEEFPAHSSYELADILIKRTGMISSVSGSITGAVPWPFTMLLAFPDLLWLLIMQTRLILKIAILAGKDPSDDRRMNELLACLGAAAGAVTGTVAVRKFADRALVTELLPFVIKKIAVSYAKSVSSKLIPFLGGFLGGSLNYLSTSTLGGIARDYYFPIKSEIVVSDDGIILGLSEEGTDDLSEKDAQVINEAEDTEDIDDADED